MQNNSNWRNSPLSPTNWPPTSFPIIDSLVVAIGAIAITIATILVTYAGLRVVGIDLQPGIPMSKQAVGAIFTVQCVFYIVLLVYLILALPLLAKRTWADLGLRKPSWRDIRIGGEGAIAMFLVVVASAAIVQHLSGQEHEQSAVKVLRSLHDPADLALFSVFAVLFAPMVEEIAFRAFLFNVFLRRTGVLTAAALSGIIFGAVHAELFAIVPLALGGMVLAITYYRTGCIWSSIVAHAAFNSIEVAGVLLGNLNHTLK